LTSECVAVHRKRHAHGGIAKDPHSPQTRRIRKMRLRGSEPYRAAARVPRPLAAHGRRPPDD
jgi:stearoyl-CoA desaturase (delta-9 desaturase)